MPLRRRLLKIPCLQARYLEFVRQIAESALDWSNLGPIVAEQRALIEDAVEQDTRKLDTFAAFLEATSPESQENADTQRATSLRDFADKRRQYLLKYKAPPLSPDREHS